MATTIFALISIAGLAATIGTGFWMNAKQREYAEGVVNRADEYATKLKQMQKDGVDVSAELAKANQFLNSVETDLKSGKFSNSAIQSKIESILNKRQKDAEVKAQNLQKQYESNLNSQQHLRDQYSADEQVAAAKLNKDLVLPQTFNSLGQAAMYVGSGGVESSL